MAVGPVRATLRWAGWLAGLLAVAMAAAAYGLWWMPLSRTPAEYLRYLERRIDGHPRLERLTDPFFALLRARLPGTFSDPDLGPLVVAPVPQTVPAAPQPVSERATAATRLLRVGPTRSVRTLAEASRAAGDGFVVEIDPGDYVADVAVWQQKALTLRGTGPGVRLIAAGAHAEGKAIWVIRNGHFVVENIVFAGVRVPDRNGAGIRFEGGHLVVRNCVFHGSQSGILASNVASARLEVENSEFGYLGAGDGQSHGIYAGAIASLVVTGSYFHHGNVGHHVKSRARETFIAYSRFTDEPGGRSSYEIDLSNGGKAALVGNLIQQGTGQQNSVMVSFGSEGYRWPRNELRVVHNTLVNDEPRGGSLVRARPGADLVQMRNNLLVGRGRLDLPEGADTQGDRKAEWPDFVQAARHDYRPTARAAAAWSDRPLAAVQVPFQPSAQYGHPARAVPLKALPSVPGAQQP